MYLNLQHVLNVVYNVHKWTESLLVSYMFALGELVKILVHTEVTRYLDFKVVEGSYVFKTGKVHKVPGTEEDAQTSGDR